MCSSINSAALISEKRRKRRESHNLVERRRRDNINERIAELAQLLPSILLEPAQAHPGSSQARSENDAGGDEANSPSDFVGSLGTPHADGFSSNPPAQLTAQQIAQQQAANKPNKGVILAKSVEYIRYLQQVHCGIHFLWCSSLTLTVGSYAAC
jgi:hypothetical protein